MAQPVTLSELQGFAVEANVVLTQQIRREGKEFPVRLDQRLRFVFLPGDMVEWQIAPVSHTPRGAKPGPTRKGRAPIGKPIEAKGLGGGEALFTFADGAFTTLRTYGGAGGYKRVVTFTRSGNTVACNIRETFMREEGVGRVTFRSSIDNAPVTVLSANQTSSNCKVVKTPAP